MKLFAQLGPQLIPVRNLNEAEISDHAKYVPLIVEARNRLDLFQILQMNYREWRKYLDSLLSTRPSDGAQECLELNRLSSKFHTYVAFAATRQKRTAIGIILINYVPILLLSRFF
jgi:hypothetical protein